MSLTAVIESIEHEMFDRATKERSTEMVDATKLEDDTDNGRRYMKGRKDNCESEA